MLHATLVIRPSSVTESVLIWNKLFPSQGVEIILLSSFQSSHSWLTSSRRICFVTYIPLHRVRLGLSGETHFSTVSVYLLDRKLSDRSGKKNLYELYSIYRVSSVTQNESDMLWDFEKVIGTSKHLHQEANYFDLTTFIVWLVMRNEQIIFN